MSPPTPARGVGVAAVAPGSGQVQLYEQGVSGSLEQVTYSRRWSAPQDLGGTLHHVPLSRMRASIDRACTSKPSARAMGAAALASSAASALILTSVKRRRNLPGR